MDEKVLNDKQYENDRSGAEQNFASDHSISALDWGLLCAYRNRKNLLFLSLLPALIEVIVGFSSYSRVLSPRELFLAFALVSLVTSWLITSSCLIAFRVVKSRDIDIFDLSATAFVNLPKTLLCYLSILGVLLIAFYLQPLLLVFVFLIWAPVFCIAEICTYGDNSKKEKGKKIEETERENFFNKKTILMDDASLFRNKSAFELGFARSLNLASRNISTTFHSALVLWAANVVPVAIVYLIFPTSLGFFPEVIKIFITTFAFAFAVCAVSGAFILLLSNESLSELGITNDDKLLLSLSEKPVLSLSKNYFATLALSILALGSTFLFFDHVKKVKSVPVKLSSELVRADLKNKRLFLSLKLKDEVKKFRWLEQQNFRLKLELDKEINDKNLIVPVATKIENEKAYFTKEPLILNLEFNKEIKENQEFEIYYASMFAKPKLIFKRPGLKKTKNKIAESKKTKSRKQQNKELTDKKLQPKAKKKVFHSEKLGARVVEGRTEQRIEGKIE